MAQHTYEESVRWMRSQPEYAELVRQCYLDEDNLAAAKRFASSEEFAAVSALLGLDGERRGLKILDLGCGNGIASYAFASLGHDVYAVDPDDSADVGAGAAERLLPAVEGGTITVVRSFVEELPFGDAAFDIVYARQVLHHFSDLRKGIAECWRVLKPGGLLFATREHVVTDERQLKVFLEEHILHRMHGGENAYTVAEYLSTIESAGFKVLKCLAPFDSVINYFPESDEALRQRFFQASRRRFGRVIASLLLRIPRAEEAYRRRLSMKYDVPGRLYSFLCRKESRGQ